jgi:hypothetical protein
MLAIVAFVLGGLWGGFAAYRRKGSRLDMAQYAAVYGIICAIVAVIVIVALDRAG